MFKVLFDFEGQDEGELTVHKGETVRISKKNGKQNMDPGWTLVERLAPPFAKGYVPTGMVHPSILQACRSHKPNKRLTPNPNLNPNRLHWSDRIQRSSVQFYRKLGSIPDTAT